MASLELENVSYVYSRGTPFEKTALHDINLRFSEGRITGLIGHTGSGKSTLVQMLNGLLRPDTGRVLLDGRDIWADPQKIREVRFAVGLVFQYPEYQLFEETVYRDMAFGPQNMGLGKAEIDRRITEAARFCGVTEDLFEKSPFELSGGQKRRVAIAGVMAMDSDVLILDEPAAGLDPQGREDILGGLRSYQREKNKTVIIVSHSMEDMALYSDEIVVMKEGTVAHHGSCEEVFGHSDILRGAGLDVPQITLLIEKLRAGGMDIPSDIYTVDRAVEVIRAMFRRRAAEKAGDRRA